jgi:hypothetical protein
MTREPISVDGDRRGTRTASGAADRPADPQAGARMAQAGRATPGGGAARHGAAGRPARAPFGSAARIGAVALLACWSVGAAYAADSLFRQEPANDDAFLGSSWHAPDGSEEDQFAWDDFRLERAASLTELRWQGGYAPGVESVPVSGFTISVFASAAGDLQPELSGTALALYVVAGNAGETAVGTAGGAPLYDYRYVLGKPFPAKAGVTYWVQIEAAQRGTPTWGLARATSGDDRHFRKLSNAGDPYFQTVQGDAAFEWSGTVVADRPAAAAPAAPAANGAQGAPASPAGPR